jgi:hypothetical protein
MWQSQRCADGSVLDSTSQIQWELFSLLSLLNQAHFSSLLITVQFNENVRLMYSGRVRTSGSEGNHNRLGASYRLELYERPTSSPS